MDEVDSQLFHREAPRLVAALTRIFGVHNLALAEDVVQDAFCKALEAWRVGGVPENPRAWLSAAARNRALDIVRRERSARRFAPEMGRLLESEWAPLVHEAFDPLTIRDEQLRMMFSCCHPSLTSEAQLVLVLHILCGFTAPEIAAALLLERAAVEKRISRGKKALAQAPGLFDLRGPDLPDRLSTVQQALYLLFNEGYHGASESMVRTELCQEAMRLTALLLEHEPCATPTTAALGALLCLHAARLGGRLDEAGDLSPLGDQDRSRWDAGLLDQGLALLERSAAEDRVSPYHLEAAIAAVHVGAATLEDTDWSTIVSLYDRLMAMSGSPVVALNRAIAIGQRDGPAAGLDALRAIPDQDRLSRYPFYPAALGEFELRQGDPASARAHFQVALGLARSEAERRFLERRIQACGVSLSPCS